MTSSLPQLGIGWTLASPQWITIIALLNALNPTYGVANICHQIHCIRWGHTNPFHTSTSLWNWYKIIYMVILYIDLHGWNQWTWFPCICNLGCTCILIDELLRFIIESFCSDVCDYHRCPQSLAVIHRNTNICCSFRAVGAREKYRGSSYYCSLSLSHWCEYTINTQTAWTLRLK